MTHNKAKAKAKAKSRFPSGMTHRVQRARNVGDGTEGWVGYSGRGIVMRRRWGRRWGTSWVTRCGAWVLAAAVAGVMGGAARAQQSVGQQGGTVSRGAAGSVEAPKPVATIATGWTYLWADQGAGYRANLNGWFVRPTVNLPRGYGVFFSSTNYYGKNAKGSVNSHGFTAGVVKQVFARPRFKATVFLESGDVRASSAGTITNELLVATGVGVTIPLAKWVSVAMTPAEYVFLYPHGDWRNDYNGKLGLSFPIGHW
jgi:hypothetical protein